MARDPRTVEIDGDRYLLDILPAGKAIRLLAGWQLVEAAMQDAAADAIALERRQKLPEWLGEREPNARVSASEMHERARRIEAAVARAQAGHLLTEDGITRVVLPMLSSVCLLVPSGSGSSVVQLAGGNDGAPWESHFAGRVDTLLKVVDAAKHHNFSDFFGGSPDVPDVEPEAAHSSQQGSSTETPSRTSRASSGRPSVRVSPVG